MSAWDVWCFVILLATDGAIAVTWTMLLVLIVALEGLVSAKAAKLKAETEAIGVANGFKVLGRVKP